jgi:tetratricopeptide (TPR) repeat protein
MTQATAALLFFLCTLTAEAAQEPSELMAEGRERYATGDYVGAVRAFERLVAASPLNSDYFLWLGRAYGRSAQEASWFRALGLAKKTRRSFEKAVELNQDNTQALLALFEYYATAPRFLGGSASKAEDIAARLMQLDPKLGAEAQGVLAK